MWQTFGWILWCRSSAIVDKLALKFIGEGASFNVRNAGWNSRESNRLQSHLRVWQLMASLAPQNIKFFHRAQIRHQIVKSSPARSRAFTIALRRRWQLISLNDALDVSHSIMKSRKTQKRENELDLLMECCDSFYTDTICHNIYSPFSGNKLRGKRC